MKELELTSNAALTDAVYETALNGSFLEVKLVAGSVGDDEPRGMQPEYECYHISYPDKKDTILFEQPLDEGGNLAASKIRNLECPNYEICLIDYGCGKFNRKIHIMEQYP